MLAWKKQGPRNAIKGKNCACPNQQQSPFPRFDTRKCKVNPNRHIVSFFQRDSPFFHPRRDGYLAHLVRRALPAYRKQPKGRSPASDLSVSYGEYTQILTEHFRPFKDTTQLTESGRFIFISGHFFERVQINGD